MSLNWFYDLAWPQRHFERDPAVIAGTKIFLQTSVIGLLFRWPGAIYAYNETSSPFPETAIFYALALTFSLLLFRFLQKTFWPAQMMMVAFSIYAAILMYFTGGSSSPTLIPMSLVIFFALLVLGWRWTVVWSFAFLLLIGAFVLLEILGHLPPNVYPLAEMRVHYSYNFIVLIIVSVFYAYIYHQALSEFNNSLRSQRTESAHLLQILSHDLRSPLQIIQSYAQLLGNGNEQKKMDYLKQIQKAVDRSATILNRVREYEGVLSGKRALKLEAVDPVFVVEEALEHLTDALKDKEIKVKKSFEACPDISADSVALLEQVLTNLFSNAIKFSSRGGEIEVRVFSRQGFVHIEVEDHGIGIPEEVMKNLFHFSKSAHRLGTEGEKGSGFGMPIAKLFLDEMKAAVKINTVDIDDDPKHHGTKITMLFPLH